MKRDEKMELVAVMDCRGKRGLDLYAVPKGTTNPQDAIHYTRVGYWDEDEEFGCWVGLAEQDYIPEGQTGYTDKDDFPCLGEAY